MAMTQREFNEKHPLIFGWIKNTLAEHVYFLLAGVTCFFMFWMFTVRGIQVLIKQHAAESYPSVQGRMLASEMQTYTGSKGRIHYRAAFQYEYAVNGLNYRGSRYRYGGYLSDEAAASALVAAHPRGAGVTVYYNPANPADTVLSPKVESDDVFRLFLTSPFVLIMVLVLPLVKAGRELDWPFGGPKAAGGLQVITEMMVTRVRLPNYQPWALGLMVAGGLSVVAGILMACGLPSGPPLAVGGWLLCGVLLGGAAMYGWHRQRLAAGRQDLVIDECARTVELPLTYKRRERRPVPMTDLKAVVLAKVPHRGKRGRISYTYAPTLEMRDGTLERLTDLSQSRAESFADWLREKLRLPDVPAVIDPVELVAGTPFTQLNRNWMGLRGWQRGVIGTTIIVTTFVVIVGIVYLSHFLWHVP